MKSLRRLNKKRENVKREEDFINHLMYVGDPSNGLTGLVNVHADSSVKGLAEALGAFMNYADIAGRPIRYLIEKSGDTE